MPSLWPLSRRLELVLLLCYLALWSRTWPRWGAAWEIVRDDG